jgi:Ni/Fe-hydrogenase subunit HybB-like protein
LHKELELPLMTSLARVLSVALAVYLSMRFMDLAKRGALWFAVQPTTEAYLFMLEISLMLLPMLLLLRTHIRRNPGALYTCALLVVLGFVTNRLNVSVTGMEAGSGAQYIPAWTEIAVTLSIIALGFAIFRAAARRLPIFEHA